LSVKTKQFFFGSSLKIKKFGSCNVFFKHESQRKKMMKSLSFLKKSLNPKIRIGLKKSLFDYGSQTILKLDFMFGSSYLQCHNQGVVQT
jgi:hypothetical protein